MTESLHLVYGFKCLDSGISADTATAALEQPDSEDKNTANVANGEEENANVEPSPEEVDELNHPHDGEPHDSGLIEAIAGDDTDKVHTVNKDDSPTQVGTQYDVRDIQSTASSENAVEETHDCRRHVVEASDQADGNAIHTIADQGELVELNDEDADGEDDPDAEGELDVQHTEYNEFEQQNLQEEGEEDYGNEPIGEEFGDVVLPSQAVNPDDVGSGEHERHAFEGGLAAELTDHSSNGEHELESTAVDGAIIQLEDANQAGATSLSAASSGSSYDDDDFGDGFDDEGFDDEVGFRVGNTGEQLLHVLPRLLLIDRHLGNSLDCSTSNEYDDTEENQPITISEQDTLEGVLEINLLTRT